MTALSYNFAASNKPKLSSTRFCQYWFQPGIAVFSILQVGQASTVGNQVVSVIKARIKSNQKMQRVGPQKTEKNRFTDSGFEVKQVDEKTVQFAVAGKGG